jgi:hypothetical protein
MPENWHSYKEFVAEQHDLAQRQGLLAHLEPRRIHAPPGYFATDSVAAGLFTILQETLLRGTLPESAITTAVASHVIAFQVIRYRVPTYYIAEDFARAVAATDLPHDLRAEDLHWPMPGIVLGFPVRFMLDYLGREVCFVNAANIDAGRYAAPAILETLKIDVSRPNVAWQCWVQHDSQIKSCVASHFRDGPVDEAVHNTTYLDYDKTQSATTHEYAKAFLARLSALMFKLLVVLNTSPRFVEAGRCIRPQKIRHGRVKLCELWSPNVIGGGYRVAQENPNGGTHASPRLHYRRGHLRNQPHGPGWSMRKLIWVQPVLVGTRADQSKAETN